MASRSLSLTVAVLFEGGVGRGLERWRRFYDPVGADRIPAHLTLVAPFAAQPPLLALERHLWTVCHSWSPIWLELGDVRRDADLFYVDLTAGGPELARLRDGLCTGPLAAQTREAGAFQPRLILAEPADDRELAVASRTLLGNRVRGSYEVKRVHLMAAHADGSWYVRDYFGLDGTYASPMTGRAGATGASRGAG